MVGGKGQIKPKAVWACSRFSQKTKKWICFAFCEKQKANKTNSFIRFLGESTARQSAFGFIWPLGIKNTGILYLDRIIRTITIYVEISVVFCFRLGLLKFNLLCSYTLNSIVCHFLLILDLMNTALLHCASPETKKISFFPIICNFVTRLRLFNMSRL